MDAQSTSPGVPVRTITALAIAIALVTSACGGDAESAGEVAELPIAAARVVDEPTTTLTTTDERPLEERLIDIFMDGGTRESAECMATTLIADLGEERLIELRADVPGAELDEDELTDADKETIATATANCFDVEDFLVARMTSDWGADAAACMMPLLDEQPMRDIIRASMLEDPIAEADAQERLDATAIAAAIACDLDPNG